MTETAKRFDPAEGIRDAEEARLWLKEFESDGTPAEFVSALNDVVRAFGMARLAEEIGIPADKLFKALNRYPPRLHELRPILERLGVRPSSQSQVPKDAAE